MHLSCGQRHLRLPFPSSRQRCQPVRPIAADRWNKVFPCFSVHGPSLSRLIQDVYRHTRPSPTRYRSYLPPVVPNMQEGRQRTPRVFCARL